MKIQEVTSPGGIKAWLVEEYSVPLISIKFAFRGGSVQDDRGKEGTAYLLSGLLDEGAGDMNSEQFQSKLEELAIRMSFDADRDNFTGSFKTLSEYRDEAFRLLSLALNKPRFEADAIERIKVQIATSIKMDLKDPGKIAAKAWYRRVFGDHPYARSSKGTLETLKAITKEDMAGYMHKVLARDNLTIAVVGAIDAKTLGKKLDEVFASLPEKAQLAEIGDASFPENSSVEVIDFAVPQSTVVFGTKGIKRADPDFIPAYVLNYILGGGGFSSRLMEEIREKRGLAYSVYSYLYPMDKAALFMGGIGTKNASVREAIERIRAELDKLAQNPPTKEELENAKTYLTGSYALRFDTSSKIASQLLWIQVENLGTDYIEKRNNLINAVTAEDLKRVGQRLFGDKKLVVTVVGKPVGMTDTRKTAPATPAKAAEPASPASVEAGSKG